MQRQRVFGIHGAPFVLGDPARPLLGRNHFEFSAVEVANIISFEVFAMPKVRASKALDRRQGPILPTSNTRSCILLGSGLSEQGDFDQSGASSCLPVFLPAEGVKQRDVLSLIAAAVLFERAMPDSRPNPRRLALLKD